MISLIPLQTPQALDWIQLIFSSAVLLQCFEYFAIRKSFNDHGVWRASTLQAEWQHFWKPIRRILVWWFQYRPFLAILGLRAIAALYLIALACASNWTLLNQYPHWADLLSFFALITITKTSVLISMRWRGTFNGGSDYMSLIVSMGLLIARGAQAFAPYTELPLQTLGPKIALYYIAVQSTLSYFIAGLVKLRHREWRQGRALIDFLETPGYDVPKGILATALASRNGGSYSRNISWFVSWTMMLWEFTFPFFIAFSQTRMITLALGWAFHLANVYVLGLNRFFWMWWATYPAILWLPVFN